MALKPAVTLVSAGAIVLLAGAGLATFNWQLLNGAVLWPDRGVWLAVAVGVLLGCTGLVLLMLGVQRMADARDARRMADGPVGPLAGRTELRSSQWPSEQ
ncbi:hypothetical protein [Arthrobacter pigmenti]